MNRSAYFTLAIALGTLGFSACGRNPGAQARAYPGTEKLEEALSAAESKCFTFEPSRLAVAAVVTGKEKFATDRKGVFTLESFEVAQAFGRIDHKVASSVFLVTEFDDTAGRAPRLAFEASCLDLKGQGVRLAYAPVTKIDSNSGRILESQPLTLDVAADGRMRAKTNIPVRASQVLPAGKVPEAALLLGSAYAESFQTLSFRAKEAEDGSLDVTAEFIGTDPTLSRIYRVHAVYGWEAAE